MNVPATAWKKKEKFILPTELQSHIKSFIPPRYVEAILSRQQQLSTMIPDSVKEHKLDMQLEKFALDNNFQGVIEMLEKREGLDSIYS